MSLLRLLVLATSLKHVDSVAVADSADSVASVAPARRGVYVRSQGGQDPLDSPLEAQDELADFPGAVAQVRRKQSAALATLVVDGGTGSVRRWRAPKGNVSIVGRFAATVPLDKVAPLTQGIGPPRGWSATNQMRSDNAGQAGRLTSYAFEPEESGELMLGDTIYRWVFPTPAMPYHFKSIACVEPARFFRLQSNASAASVKGRHSAEPCSVGMWAMGFFITLGMLGLLSTHCGSVKKVNIPHYDANLESARGRHCWITCCAANAFLLCSLVFAMTLVSIMDQNRMTRVDPVAFDPMARDGEDVIVHMVRHPGERAFESGNGVALSVAIGWLVMLNWRHSGMVQITLGLLALFAVRGATVSLFISVLLEISGDIVLKEAHGDSSIRSHNGPDILTLCQMLVAGVSEETSKVLALICGTWICAGALSAAAVPYRFLGCWRVLVESPRALMLAGLSIGFGFMTIENAGYLLTVAGTPPMDYRDEEDGSIDHLGGMALRVLRIVIILVRVLLNLHPWLAGIAAARIARITFGEHRHTASLSGAEFLWCIWPSAMTHATYDFLILAVPGFLGICLPPVFWGLTCWAFVLEWDKAASAEEGNDGHGSAPGLPGHAAPTLHESTGGEGSEVPRSRAVDDVQDASFTSDSGVI